MGCSCVKLNQAADEEGENPHAAAVTNPVHEQLNIQDIHGATRRTSSVVLDDDPKATSAHQDAPASQSPRKDEKKKKKKKERPQRSSERGSNLGSSDDGVDPVLPFPTGPEALHNRYSSRSSDGSEPEEDEEAVERPKTHRINSANKLNKRPSRTDFLDSHEGFLHRKDEFSNDDWARFWVVLEGNKMLYYATKLDRDLKPDRPTGYLEFEHLVLKQIGPQTTKRSTKVGHSCISLKRKTATVVFSAENPEKLSGWIDAIHAGIDGAMYRTPETKQASAEEGENERKAPSLLDFPQMTGPLFKQAIGKSMRSSFGKGGEKKRWFKLQGGELRYYAKDDLRPNSLKGTVPLAGCNISLNEKEPRCFSVELPDGKVLVVRGESDKEVQRWVSALTDTLDMMNKNEKHQPGKRRHRILISEDSNASGSGGHKTHNVVEKEQSTKDALVTALEQHFLFKKVGDLTEVIDSLHPVYFMSGDVICWQGDPGELFFCLEHGKAEVIINGASVATLHHGSAFGELALIHNVPRAATIRSVTNCQLWAVDRVTFRTLLASTASHSRDEKVAALRNVSLFQNLNDAAIDRISDALQIVTFASGDYIIKQGDLGDRFYVVKSGEVIVTQSSSGGYENELTRCQVGDYFGEIALMQDEPRKANVKALSPTVECYSLDRASFTSMMGSLKTVLEKNTSIQLLKGVHLLKGLSAEELEKVAAAVQHREYSDGDEIIRQGDKGNDFFIIQEGVVMVQVNGEVVTELGSGAYFGELALLSNQRRAATVIAKGNAVLKSLDRADFDRLLGPLEGVMKREATKRKGKLANFGRMLGGMKQSKKNRRNSGKGGAAEEPGIQLGDLEHLRVLGTGTFGQVTLVLHSPSNRKFALKSLAKQTLVEMHLEKRIFVERDTLQNAEHPFIVTLYMTSSDTDSLYMCMELLPGGDLWALLYSKNPVLPRGTWHGLRLPHAKFYAANVLSVLSYMNESGILYRDLKPENLVLDAMGYLKLVDFGLAKKIMPSERTYTMCGTPDYLAPELISGGGYGRSCDLWSFGILLFELVTRRTPFFDENQSQMMNKIINSDQFLSGAFPKSLDSSLKELIKRLLDPNPAMRMGNLEHGVDDIWEHPWFIELRRENIEQRALNAPFAPPVLQESSNELRADPVPLSSGSAHFFSGFDMDLKPPTYPDE